MKPLDRRATNRPIDHLTGLQRAREAHLIAHAKNAMLRLLDRVAAGTNDPAVFGGLVTACRYCGLLEASAAAHEQARQLDPKISTSAQHTYWMLGRYDEALAAVDPDRDFGDAALIYESMGRMDEAIAVFDDRARRLQAAGSRADSLGFQIFSAFRATLEKRGDEAYRIFQQLSSFADPEGIYRMGRAMARVGRIDTALDRVDAAVDGGFFCYPFFIRDAWLDPLRGNSRFADALRKAEARMRDAEHAFEAHPASRVLGVGVLR